MPGGDTAPQKLGRYELITQIGHGGMAEVRLALQRGPAGFEKLVVIKLVHENLATQKTFVDMLLDEARVAALVKHPNVVDIYDLGEAEGRYYIAMEYLEGEPLLSLLRAGRDGKRLDPLSTARLVADTAEGLDAAHELRTMAGKPLELVHHDVSLGNIVVLYNGQVKLVDFGVAKAMSAGPSTKVHGKFGYMAPEKLRGKQGDRRSDIWSLGVVLWEALTLRRLFKASSERDTIKLVLDYEIPRPSSINGDVLPDLDPIVMRALERDPDRRYARAKELAQDIEEVLRVNGYGGRNDQIARYMQSTFAEHIDARKKLLQEVSTKGSASDDVLEAAFAEPVDPTGVRSTQEFSIRFTRNSMTPHDPTPISGVTPLPTPPTGMAPRMRVPRPSAEHKVEVISAVPNARPRTSEQLMAEGTPVVSPPIPRRTSKPMFAEATPVISESDIVALDQSNFRNVRSDTVADADAYDRAAGMMEAVDPPTREVSQPAIHPASEVKADATLDLADILDSPIDVSPQFEPAAAQELAGVRNESLNRAISSVLDIVATPPEQLPDPTPVPARTSARMAAVVPEGPRTSQRMAAVGPKPTTPKLEVKQRATEIVQIPTVGVTLSDERKPIWPYLLAGVILLAAAGIVVLLVMTR